MTVQRNSSISVPAERKISTVKAVIAIFPEIELKR
jgi:hypothetical protein